LRSFHAPGCGPKALDEQLDNAPLLDREELVSQRVKLDLRLPNLALADVSVVIFRGHPSLHDHHRRAKDVRGWSMTALPQSRPQAPACSDMCQARASACCWSNDTSVA
jgi:hypothetical protein